MSFPWAKEYQPKTEFTRWMDQRLPLPRMVYNAVGAGYPVPRNLNYFWNFGVLAGFFLVVQIVTGIVMAMHYAANVDVAFASIEHTVRDVNYGWLMRYAHANGASFFFIVVYIHMGRGLYFSSYKAPREMIWLLGLVIFLLMMATAFMGYVLPWGQMSFWGAQVITGLFSAIPLVGETLQLYTRNHYVGRLHKLGVTVQTHARFYGADENTVWFQDTLTRAPVVFEAVDTLVLSLGHLPNGVLETQIDLTGIEYYAIGDCESPRTAEEAVYEGLLTGIKI